VAACPLGGSVEGEGSLVHRVAVAVFAAMPELSPELQRVLADYLAEVLAELQRKIGILLRAAGPSGEPRDVEPRSQSVPIGRINLRNRQTNFGSPDGAQVRVQENVITGCAEAGGTHGPR